MPEEKESFIDIDNLALDKEWMEQAGIYLRWARKLAKAKLTHAEAKAQLEVDEALLSKVIRDKPENFGIQKVTEPVIESTIKLQQSYQKSLRNLNEAKYSVDKIQAVVDALEHRKKALENAVTLHIQGYTAEPRTRNKEINDKYNEMARDSVMRQTKIKKKN
jgi:hypothetical protein